MTGQWSADQSTWPAHLRDDAPSQQCGRCGRYTRSPSQFGAECRMPQPDGYPCGGRFESPGILLDLYAALVGAPIPADTTTPLHEDYTRVGKGWVRLAYPEPQEISDLIVRTVVGNPHLLIRWEENIFSWQSPDIWGRITMHTLIGHGTTSDGQVVRMIAHRCGRAEYDEHRGKATATVDLHRDEPSGGCVTWYYRKTPAVGETWRGYNHGSLLKVTAVDEQHVHALWVYTGNPYYADRLGTVGRFGLEGWTELCEYAPEWNDHTTRPGGF